MKFFSSADFDVKIKLKIASVKQLGIFPVAWRLKEDTLKTDQGCCIDCVTAASNLSKNIIESFFATLSTKRLPTCASLPLM